jgi:murein L,D-transpeptidase YafK
MNPESSFHLSFDLGYPNEYDQAHGRTGTWLMVHGDCISAGCFAMTDPLIEEIYTIADAALTNGQKQFRAHCFPFKMTPARMEKAEREGGEWIEFWRNLKTGYDWFEEHRVPPDVSVEDGEYRFATGS